jgi:putative intracellular protease/amidase
MKYLAIIFNGFEEEEAMAPFAILRRCKLDRTIASASTSCTGCHNITLTDLTPLNKVNYVDYDCLILPGGPHYRFLETEPKVKEIIDHFMAEKKMVAAICASPTILGKMGYLEGKNYTCFTSMNDNFGGNYTDEGVTVDGNIISAKSVAYSLEFAYKIVEETQDSSVLENLFKRIYHEK